MSRIAEAVPPHQRAGNWHDGEASARLQRKLQRFESLVMPHLDAAYNLARWLSGNDEDARNVSQQAGMRAFEGLDSFPGDDPRAWMLGIVRTTYYNELPDARAQDEPARDTVQPVSPVARNGAQLPARLSGGHVIDRALARLPVTLREIVVLRELEALSYGQIAEIVAMPVKAVVMQMACAMELLQDQIMRLDPQVRQ